MNQYTILIQGPLNIALLESIPNYCKYGNIILSTCHISYSETEYKILSSITNQCKVILYIDKEYDCFNTHNIYKQAISTLEGLKECDSEYVIKLRSDEFYENLQPVIDKLSTECLVCSDFFYNDGHTLQISDHIIGGTTSSLLKTFNIVKIWCECIPKNKKDSYAYGRWFGLDFDPVTESIIFAAYLRSKQELPIEANSHLFRKAYTLPINRNLLGKYLAIANCLNKKYTDVNPEGITIC